MSLLTLFGFITVSLMVVFYVLEEKSYWFTLLFSLTCFLSSLYGFLAGTVPFGFVEFIWAMMALYKWYKSYKKNLSVI